MSARTTKPRSLRSWPCLELALILAISLLVLQISGPTVHRWWHSPAPGKLGIDYVGEDLKVIGMSPAYLCYLPRSYQEDDSWPLVVFLHGSGGRGDNPNLLRQIAETLVESSEAEASAVVLVPQCLPRSGWQSEDVYKFVEHASQRYRIDPQRVYLLGYSMGGYGAWPAAAAHPQSYAAIVPMACGGSTDHATALAEVPTWVFVGDKDRPDRVEQSRSLVDAIRDAGGSAKFTLYSETGHDIRDRVFRTPELWAWLFQQSLEQRQQPTAVSSANASDRGDSN